MHFSAWNEAGTTTGESKVKVASDVESRVGKLPREFASRRQWSAGTGNPMIQRILSPCGTFG